MWKKLLTPTLIFTLVILFALTWYVSIKAEEHFTLWVERSNQVAPAITTTELISYDRQFFTAEAITTIDIQDIGRYDFHHLIRHYVWGLTVITTPATTAEDPGWLAGLRIVTEVGPTGAARTRLSLPQLRIESDFGPTLSIERVAFEGRANATATEGSWDMTLDQLNIMADTHQNLSISGFKSSGEMTNLDYFPLGHNRTRINRITLDKSDGKPLVLEGLNLSGSSFFDTSGQFQSRSDLSFTGLATSTSSFQDGRLILALREIDDQVIDVVVAVRNDLRRRLNSTTMTGAEVAELVVEPLSTALLQSGLTLALEDISLATTTSNLRGEGKATLPAGSAAISVEQLLEKIHVSLKADFDIHILARISQLFSGTADNVAVKEEELRMLIGGLAQLGFFSHLEGDRFRLLVSYDDGEITLNGQMFRLF